MMIRSTFLIVAFIAFSTSTFADPNCTVCDDFESYANDAALQAQWVSSTASSTSTFLIDPNSPQQDPNNPFPILPTPGGLDGQAAVFDGSIGIGSGSVNVWSTPFNISPSATQNVELSVDLGNEALTSNKKLSLGLRYVDPNGGPTENIIELGFWNQLPFDPNDSVGILQFAHRSILLPGGDNWVGYDLPFGQNQPFEIGPAFHRFGAVISESDITFTLDLFADGVINHADGDFNNDNIADGLDFLGWQINYGDSDPNGGFLQGDGNKDLEVDNDDLVLWENDYGIIEGETAGLDAVDVDDNATVTANGFNNLRFGIPSATGSSADPFLRVDNVVLRLVDLPPSLSGVSVVPEPSTLLLGLSAGLCFLRRNRPKK